MARHDDFRVAQPRPMLDRLIVPDDSKDGVFRFVFHLAPDLALS